MEAAASHPDAETLTGRGRVYVVPAPAAADGGPDPAGGGPERWVVRHYHRGGAMAPILRDRYLRVGTPRPLRELRLGRALEERGVPTPAHIAAAVYPSGIWYRGDLVTRYVPGSRDLAAVLFPVGQQLSCADPDVRNQQFPHTEADGGNRQHPRTESDAPAVDPGAAAAMRAAGRLFRVLHEAGVVHPDLNLKNILVAGSGEDLTALALDLDGARLRGEVGGGARRRMIARFRRSARKWQRATGIELDPALESAFEAGYTG